MEKTTQTELSPYNDTYKRRHHSTGNISKYLWDHWLKKMRLLLDRIKITHIFFYNFYDHPNVTDIC